VFYNTLLIYFLEIIPPTLHPPKHTQYTNNCVNLQPLPAKNQCHETYQSDPDTKFLIDRLSIIVLLDKVTNLKFSMAYHTSITRN